MAEPKAKKHPHHGIPKSKHRPRSLAYTIKQRANLAQKASLRQRVKVEVTLAKPPWAK